VVLVDTPFAPVVLPTSIRLWGDRWAVLDGPSRDVKVFDSSGDLLFIIGRSGGGPGEFTSPTAISRARGDSLAVLDTGSSRISMYCGSGLLGREVPLPAGRYRDLVALDDGRFVLAATPLDAQDSLAPRIHVLEDGAFRSVGLLPSAFRRGEISMESLSVTQIGSTIVVYRITSNRGVHVDLATGAEYAVSVGESIYRPIEWIETGDQQPDLGAITTWWNRQMAVMAAVPISDQYYLIQMVDNGAQPDPVRYYVVVDLEGRTVAIVTGKDAGGSPNFRDYEEGFLIAIDQSDHGTISIRRYSVKGSPGDWRS
jgi:hypothetical protein